MRVLRRYLRLLVTVIAFKNVLFAAKARSGRKDAAVTPCPPPITEDFTFVQITDFHLDDNLQHLQFLEEVMNEINALSPDFVVFTGDQIDAGERLAIEEAEYRYKMASRLISTLKMPVYLALGNHDIVGEEFGAEDWSDPAFGKGLSRQYFGSTYYAFDWKGTHCIVLDTNEMDADRLRCRISPQQRQWLAKETARAADKPMLVFFHQPTAEWEDRKVLKLLKNAHAMFSGHWHYNVMLESEGIPEQVTGALCGEWWYGPGPEGRKAGYRIVHVSSSGVSSTYRELGCEPEPHCPVVLPPIFDDAMLIADVLDDFHRFQGRLVTVEGTVGLTAKGPPLLSEDIRGILIEDDSGGIVVLNEVPNKEFDSLKSGDHVKLVGVPLQYSLKWLLRSEHGAGFELMADILPEKMIVCDEEGEPKAIRLMRWFRTVS